ncbi:unnamed protein product [Brassica rapa]|uniref:Gibberellin regulated protein n=2 Tax=Brassica TaxID=3705 RepID=A0A8D9D0Y7_BRACM|nr:unnamed protein product [Brassica napus]CAG7868537.1 unnamed protein product [Brassica rapa]
MIEPCEWILSFGKRDDDDPSERHPTSSPNNVFFFYCKYFTFSFNWIMYDVACSTSWGTACGGKCNVRCSKASQHDLCIKDCNICCQKCNGCVPSGTFGHRDECPCYRDMKNSKGGPKCP